MTNVPAVRIENVRYRYTRSGPDVLKDVSLTVPSGSILGLVGESGSGKSTLGRIVVDERRQTSGVVEIEGQRWADSRRNSDLRRSVQMIFQDPFGSLNPYLSPIAAVAEAAAVTQRLSKDASRERAVELLEKVGLRGELIQRTPASLSGGQRQRVVIARALACEPRILVADEPTSALDVSVQAQILNVLMRLQADLGLTMLFISHDMGVINHITDEVAVLERGVIVESGPTEEVMRHPQHPYTQKLLAAFDVRRPSAEVS